MSATSQVALVPLGRGGPLVPQLALGCMSMSPVYGPVNEEGRKEVGLLFLSVLYSFASFSLFSLSFLSLCPPSLSFSLSLSLHTRSWMYEHVSCIWTSGRKEVGLLSFS